MTDPLPGSTLLVLNSEENRINNFWKMYIGRTASLISVDSDGLWSVLLSHESAKFLNPVDGARPSRFSVIAPPEPKPAPRKRSLMEWIFGRIAG